MVALEAWALGRPVLANGKCDVLKGQCIRSNAGLVLRDAMRSFSRRCSARAQPWLSARARRERPAVFPRAYEWPVIERKYLDMFERLRKRAAAVDDGAAARLARAAPPQPARRRRMCVGRAARGRRHAGIRSKRAARTGQRPRSAVVMQDPPGPGDARVRRCHRPRSARHSARAARGRLRVGDFRRDSGSPAGIDDARLPRAGRRQPSRQPPPPPFFARVARRRAWRTRCPIGWRSSITTSRRRNISSACTARWPRSVFADGASCAPTPTAATSRSAIRSSTGRTSKRSGSRGPACCRWCRISRISTATPNRLVAGQFDDDWTNILFVGRVIAEQEDRGRRSASFTPTTRSSTRARGCCWSARYSGFERYLAALHQLVADARRHATCTSSATSPTRSWSAYYEIADLFLCASEHEGFCVPLVEAFYKQVPVLAYAATAVPATMDGAGVLYDDKDPAHVAALMDAIVVERRLQDAHRRGSSPRSTGCGRGTSPARCSASSTTSSQRRARRSRGSPSTSGISSTPPRSSRSCGSYRPVRVYQALPDAPTR